MLWEGVCEECGQEKVEFFSSREQRDAPRTHREVEKGSSCQGLIRRYCYPSGLAVEWKYGKNDKKGTFMGPSKTVYKTDTTEASRIQKTRTVTGPSYRGASHRG